ncbi:telomere length regulation protein-domain-containing protein [Kockovaella imperatae]|uniref:Telomere length regulation protein-domain-containing protein n=1 Tax=Kockovaella imperatae TaxID=4999 RepID=A0A1Y1URK1_9TREE|nr:telomere length regulation protein-domain-containing protein [Kockovaella imperatae]ORX40562.1 telomere length regulation protein-domain-containing protein [Kockovaella imperatae]
MTLSSDGAVQSLKDLRNALRDATSELDIDSFTFLLSSTLQNLSLHPTSVPPQNVSNTLKAIERYLGSVQHSLLTVALPTYLSALDVGARSLLDRFFVPPKIANPSSLALGRAIALVSYSSLLALVAPVISSNKERTTALPAQSREYVLHLLDVLGAEYGIDQLYWAIWGDTTTSDHNVSAESSKSGNIKMHKWEETVRTAISIPAKVANAWGKWKSEGWAGDIPQGLVTRYFDRFVVKLESLMYQESHSSRGESAIIRIVFERLIAIGLLNTPPTKDHSPDASLLRPLLPPLLSHLHPDPDDPLPPYSSGYLPGIFLPLSGAALAAFVYSLLSYLAFHLDKNTALEQPNEQVKRAASIFSSILGQPDAEGEAWDAVLRCVSRASVIRNDAREVKAGIIVSWVASGSLTCIMNFTDSILDLWTDPRHIKYALYDHQYQLTYTLIRAISLVDPFEPFLVRLSHRPKFLSAMQSYLAHPDPAIRRLGMLVAEIVSERTVVDDPADAQQSQIDEVEELKAGLDVEGEIAATRKPIKGGKRLRFGGGMWDGPGEGKDEARRLRSVVGVRDNDASLADVKGTSAWILGWKTETEESPETSAPEHTSIEAIPIVPRSARATTKKPLEKQAARPKIVMLDDEQVADPLQGYDIPSPASSRSSSPTPSFLEEVTADPSLAIDAAGKKKIKRPVYVSQLMALLREREKPDHLEMALKWGESLIRSKRSFGGELEENAVNLATLTVALNNPFNLDHFDESRQGILNALVVCSPRKVAPCLCELYFIGSYSLHQRSVILTAIAMGARELAGMTVPTAPKTKKIDFPSKTLPPALHKMYISAGDLPAGQLEAAIDGVRGLLLSKGAKRGEETVPELAKEKRLRVGSRVASKVSEVGSLSDRQMTAAPNGNKSQIPVVPFRDIAAEYFILPLINRFWQHFQDASLRQSRALSSGTRYRGAGTGLLLSPMALEKFLMTLSLLLHAARHSSVYLAVLAPEALELAAAMGAQHLSQPDLLDENVPEGKEASIVGAALEMALVVLDASRDLDGGRTLAMDKHALLMAVGEWASGVFKLEEHGNGVKAAGQGGLREGRVRAAAAGVVVKVSDIAEKWGRLSIM